ncbi:AsmA family protein [Gluconacetobacter tumulisoli]|uniref:AsmA family protein n=1 Tax=Gluconacetobacter tumulisoli TaxID=1286189 RepID=A0A7W4K8N0_9PROT|nr:AsmA family protein [Gluconacetobacter tumulisoli]MBB2202320.1 AsmA family protein [Gluconacetobacter tumulisoli]
MRGAAHPSLPRRPPSRLARILDLAALALICVLVVLPWSWDWFVPLIEDRATGLLDRETTITHLHILPGRVVTATLDDLVIEQPWGFEDQSQPFATARHVVISFDLWTYLRRRKASFPLVAFDTLRVNLARRADGTDNMMAGPSPRVPRRPALPDIRDLRVEDGQLQFVDAPRGVDLTLAVHTTPPRDGNHDGGREADPDDGGRIVADLQGSYAGRPVEGHIVGGAVLALTDAGRPYPVDLTMHGGQTLAALEGTLVNPLALGGAHLSFHLSGPDLSLLGPLAGLAIPPTPAYSTAGTLDYDGAALRLGNMRAKLGSSDLDGALRLDFHSRVPALDADLQSRRVDLADLAGLLAAARDATDIPPDLSLATPIPVAWLHAIEARLRYHAARIDGPAATLDSVEADIALHGGTLDINRLAAGLDGGTLAGVMTLAATAPPIPAGLRTRVRVDATHVDLARLMRTIANATDGADAPAVTGATGIVGGHARLEATGASAAGLLAHGSGRMTLALDRGGNLFALLPALLGRPIGRTLLSALGFPNPTDARCVIADLPLHDGLLSVATLLETGAGRTLGRGTVDLRRDTLDYTLATQPAHPPPKPGDGTQMVSSPYIARLTGPLANPSILPAAETVTPPTTTGPDLAALTPALLPAVLPIAPTTTQAGIDATSPCARLLRATLSSPTAAAPPKPPQSTPAPHPAPPRPAPARPVATKPGPTRPAPARQVHHAHAKPRRPPPVRARPRPSDPHRLDPSEIQAIWRARQQQAPEPSNVP